jgi:hypothetical protein
MPSQSYLLNDLPLGYGKSRFATIMDYATSNLGVTKVVSILYRDHGFEEVILKNDQNEIFSGSGEGKEVALANAVATKYPE